MRRLGWMAVTMAMLGWIADGCAWRSEPPPALITLVKPADGKSVTLKKGDQLAVELVENATTGYTWKLANGNTAVCQLKDDKFIPPDYTLAGAPGRRIMTFEAVAAGTDTLTFVYIRPWEKDQPPGQKLNVSVQVKK